MRGLVNLFVDKQTEKISILICTPNTGHPVLGVF